MICALGAQDASGGRRLLEHVPAGGPVGDDRRLSPRAERGRHSVAETDGHDSRQQHRPRAGRATSSKQLKIPMKTFSAKDDSVDGPESAAARNGRLLSQGTRSRGAVRHARSRHGGARSSTSRRTRPPARRGDSLRPRVERLHARCGARAAEATPPRPRQMVRLGRRREAGQEKAGMERMTSPEIVAEANPDVVLMTVVRLRSARRIERQNLRSAGRRARATRREDQPHLPRGASTTSCTTGRSTGEGLERIGI